MNTIRHLRAPVAPGPSKPEPKIGTGTTVKRVFWTEDMDDELRRRRAAGQNSTDIAEALGTGQTNKAVRERARRLFGQFGRPA